VASLAGAFDPGTFSHAFHPFFWPETLHIETQIGLVRGAKVVAGVDGSALHLCAFMKEGGQCLVLESRKVPAIYAINDAAGIRTIGLPVCAWDESDGARKTLINIDQLESELKRLL